MRRYYDWKQQEELYEYYNNLDEVDKAHHQSITTNSSYHYFIKNGELFELRISDHNFNIPICGKIGYTIQGIEKGNAVELGLTFLEERFRNVGHIIKSDDFLTTVQYNDKKVTYSTEYVNQRYEEIKVFSNFEIKNVFKGEVRL